MNAEKLSALQIDRSQKQRPTGTLWIIFIVVIVATLGAVYLARPKAGDDVRRLKTDAKAVASSSELPDLGGNGLGGSAKVVFHEYRAGARGGQRGADRQRLHHQPRAH